MIFTLNESLGDKKLSIQMFCAFSYFKNTLFGLLILCSACAQEVKKNPPTQTSENKSEAPIVVGANRTENYLPLLRGKKIAVVANQTSVIFKENSHANFHTHLVDSLLSLGVGIKKVFAPEHGFRGRADAGEKVADGTDLQTGLPIISLYGKNRKPAAESLQDVDLVIFDIQDVGVRFYTYIATLQLVMEACAEVGLPVLVLDRPNPNASFVDGPTMEKAHRGFLGMTEIPLVYGMTIGEYAQMINEEGWLEGGHKVNLTVIPLENYTHNREYHLPIRPSPNLPNDQAIALYPSLGLFEGTQVNAGRGTDFQFQQFGASFLDSTFFKYTYVPEPNFGSKSPKENGMKCFGMDLRQVTPPRSVDLRWLALSYKHASNQAKFFNTSGFTRHAGTETLQKQLEASLPLDSIYASWEPKITAFKIIRKKYLRYD